MAKAKKVALIVIVIAALAVAGWYGFKKYKYWSWWRDMERQAAEFERKSGELKALIEADTYGGKTPEETLNMFITAVEAGNYELASKYFVVEKREEEMEILQKTQEKGNISFLLDYLNQLDSTNGYFSNDESRYTIERPIFIEFIKYPSGIWKINEI